MGLHALATRTTRAPALRRCQPAAAWSPREPAGPDGGRAELAWRAGFRHLLAPTVETGALAWVERRLGAGSSCKNLPRLLGMPQQPHLLEPKRCALDQRLVFAHDAERT